MNVGPFALEVRVGAHFYMNYKVTVGSPLTCMPLLGNSQVNSVVNSLGNVDRLLGGRVRNPSSSAA